MPGKGCRCNLSCAEDFAAQLDDDRVGLFEAARVEAVLDDLDDLTGDAFAERLGFTRCPFELAVELMCGREDGQFANASSQSRFVSQ